MLLQRDEQRDDRLRTVLEHVAQHRISECLALGEGDVPLVVELERVTVQSRRDPAEVAAAPWLGIVVGHDGSRVGRIGGGVLEGQDLEREQADLVESEPLEVRVVERVAPVDGQRDFVADGLGIVGASLPHRLEEDDLRRDEVVVQRPEVVHRDCVPRFG